MALKIRWAKGNVKCFVQLGWSDDEDNNYQLLPAGFPVTVTSPSSSQTYVPECTRSPEDCTVYSTCCLQSTGHRSRSGYSILCSRLLARLLTPLSTQELAIGRGCFRTSCAHLWPGQVVQRRPRDQDWYLFITRVGSGGEGAGDQATSSAVKWRNRLRFSSLSSWWFSPQILGQELSSTQQGLTTIEEIHISIFLWSWSFLGIILYTTLRRSYWSTFTFQIIQ